MEEICKPCTREDLEEILEEIWTTLELQNEIPAAGARIPVAAAGDSLEMLVSEGLVRRQDKDVILTDEGFSTALPVVAARC